LKCRGISTAVTEAVSGFRGRLELLHSPQHVDERPNPHEQGDDSYEGQRVDREENRTPDTPVEEAA
jgi:hypothetical protein